MKKTSIKHKRAKPGQNPKTPDTATTVGVSQAITNRGTPFFVAFVVFSSVAGLFFWLGSMVSGRLQRRSWLKRAEPMHRTGDGDIATASSP